MKDVDLDKVEVTDEDLMDDDLLSELNDVLGLYVCLSVCMHAYVCACMYVSICVCLCTRARV